MFYLSAAGHRFDGNLETVETRGQLVIAPSVKLPAVVAVKMLKEGHTDTEMIDLVSEMAMMKVGVVLSGTTAQPRSVSVTYRR